MGRIHHYIWVFLVLLLISGCGSKQYMPKAELSIRPDSLTIMHNNTSDSLTVSVTKKDDGDIPTSFAIKLYSPNNDYIRFYNGNASVDTIQTGTFYRKNDRLSYVFSIFGKKAEGSDLTKFTVLADLVYNNSVVDTQELAITVK
ncbi:MAG: hypothetical protein ACOCWQ_03370 [Nanoarchaeota archaeon]